MYARILACSFLLLQGACVAPVPVMQASSKHLHEPQHLVVLTATRSDQRVFSARLAYGRGRPIEVPILGMGGAGELRADPVPEAVQVSWTDNAGRRQEREIELRQQLPANMEGRTLQFEIEDGRLKVFVDTPVGLHDIERRAVYSD